MVHFGPLQLLFTVPRSLAVKREQDIPIIVKSPYHINIDGVSNCGDHVALHASVLRHGKMNIRWESIIVDEKLKNSE